nr:hypothetical protein [Tanacetum cinerariifolium]
LDALRALANAIVAADSDISSRNTSQVPTASPCAPTAGPSGTSVVPPTPFAIPPGVSGVSPGPYVTPIATSAIPADSPKVPAAVPSDSPNVPAGVSSKGKSLMVEEDIPITARSFRQREEDRLGIPTARREFPLAVLVPTASGGCSHCQKEGVPTARRMEIPLPRVCTAMMKKLPVKEN